MGVPSYLRGEDCNWTHIFALLLAFPCPAHVTSLQFSPESLKLHKNLHLRLCFYEPQPKLTTLLC